jgi:hypothetical protein
MSAKHVELRREGDVYILSPLLKSSQNLGL